MTISYPLSAIVRGEKIADAISCGLCSPHIRTILISGPSGTGKSVSARSACRLLPGKKNVELPANVTPDQIFGSLDMEKTLLEGRKIVNDSIMKRADGNILLIDNVNNISSEILQSVLDSVLTGAVMSESDGISVHDSCDTLLIATMNPEEGELNEHILDRFDICIFIDEISDFEDRKEIISRNLCYGRNPREFCRLYEASEKFLSKRITDASEIISEIPHDYPDIISDICTKMHVEGHRGDISVLNTACALATLDGRSLAGSADLKKAVELCLQHRRRDDSPEEPPPSANPPSEEDCDSDSEEGVDDADFDDDSGDTDQQQTENNDGDEGDGNENQNSSEKIFAVGEEFKVADFIPPRHLKNKNRKSGRRDSMLSDNCSGRAVGYCIPKGRVMDIALSASILSAAPYQIYRDHEDLAIILRKEDLKEKERIRNKGTKILFVVDGSGSMGARNRMISVKGAILSMLKDAYRRRDEIGLVIFRNNDAELTLPMTRSVFVAYKTLTDMPTGGRTPLLAGIKKGYEILRKDADKGSEPVMAIITDGRGNVCLNGFNSIDSAMEAVSETVRESKIRTIVIDSEEGLIRFGKAMTLSQILDADYVKLEALNAENLFDSINSALKIIGER